MKCSYISDKILKEISSVLDQIDDRAIEELVDALLASDRIFVTGLGRSGLVARSFAMRLMHLGLKVFIVGDITTPAIGICSSVGRRNDKGDLLLAISGSGETSIIYHIVKKSKESEATSFLITSKANTSIAEISDKVLILPDIDEPVLPLKSAFEASAYILFDAVVIMIMDKTGITPQEMMKRHSNLE